jgi:two-component system, NtrC family, sensor kinase
MSPQPAVDLVDLMARLPVAVYRTTPSGRILTANAAFADLIGAESVDHLHDLDVRSLYVDPGRRDHMVERVASGIQIDPEEIQLRRLDGDVIWVRVTSLGVHADDGTVQFYEGVIEDVTARRRSDRDLARSTALLAAVTRAQNRYLTGSTIGVVFDELLSDLLDFTGADSGVITRTDDSKVLICASTNGARLSAAVEAVVATRAAAIDGTTASMALPVVKGGEMIGVVGFAGGTGCFDEELTVTLQPVLATVAGLIEAQLADQARTEAERQRLIGEQRFRAVVEAANDTVLVYDAGGIIAAANPAVWQTFGRAPHELVGRSILSLLPDDEAERRRAVLLGEVEAGHAFPIDVLDEAGQRLPTEMSLGTARVDGRQVFTAVIRDVTDRKAAEDTLRRAKEAAERVSRAKDEFLAAMSHELRTPLNGVIGLSTVLARGIHGPVNDKQAEYLHQIEAAGRHLLALINDVLDLAKIEADRHQPELGPTNVGEIAAEAVAIVRESAAAKQISVTLSCPDDIPEIIADSRRTKQVMVNLLSNAVKFTEPGGAVGLDTRADAESITVEVWDTGIGIPPDRVDDLFVPFQQIDSALSRSQEGTGLGLALSRKLIDAQGGEMFFESELGRGSRFGFRLPVSGWSLDSGTGSVGDTPEPDGQVMAGTVLVVDDNDLNRMLVADYLVAHGLEVIEAHDGDEAVEAAIAARPDAIVMDIQMPGRDGLSATRELKSRADTGAIPIVALTALAMEGDRERCLEAGCDDYLSKPCDPAVVLATVTRLVQAP